MPGLKTAEKILAATLGTSVFLGAVGVLLIVAQNPYDELRDSNTGAWDVEAILHFWGLFSLFSTPLGCVIGSVLFVIGPSVWRRRARPSPQEAKRKAV